MTATIDNYEDLPLDRKIDLLKSIRSSEYLEQLANDAFQNKGGLLWKEIQILLYSMNIQLMNDGFGLGTKRSEFNWRVRNTIETIELQYLTKEMIPQNLNDDGAFMVWLKNRIYKHRVNHHPLFDYFDSDDLTNEEIRYFLSNYRVNMQKFHLHVAAYSLFVPFRMREELYDNLYDEFGQGNFDLAHPNLFEPLMQHFGGAKESDWNAETFHLLNTKMNLCWFSEGMQGGLGGMGALELSIPAQQKHILAHLRRRGLSEKLVNFFVIHCELDEDHGDGWFAAGMPYMNSQENYQKIFQAAMRILDARAGVYDGVLNGILDSRDHEEVSQEKIDSTAKVRLSA